MILLVCMFLSWCWNSLFSVCSSVDLFEFVGLMIRFMVFGCSLRLRLERIDLFLNLRDVFWIIIGCL